MRADQLLVAALLAACAMPVAAQEAIDAGAYARIRAEGLERSRVMAEATALADGFGPRLTGSPALRRAQDWTIARLAALHLADPHRERWGTLGPSWEQRSVSLTMVAPSPQTLVAQAVPWSPGTSERITAPATIADLKTDADLARYRGTLSGRILLLRKPAPLAPATLQFLRRYSDAEVDSGAATAPIRAMYARQTASADTGFARRLEAFVADEGMAAVVIPSPGGANGTGLIHDDDSSFGTGRGWSAAGRLRVPVLVATPEGYGRVARLLERGTPVTLGADVAVAQGTADEPGYNIVADLPGTDRRDEIVLVGAHLDSWTAGTGATDNASGVAIVLEAVRILRAIGLRPRRTLRVVFYDGEEQGSFGAFGYARRHLATVSDAAPGDLEPERWVASGFPWRPRPEAAKLSVAYNVDAGSGRIRAVFTNGDPALAPIFHAWAAPLADLGMRGVADERDWPADQIAFTGLGLPGVSFLQDPLDYYTRTHHSDADTADHLSEPDLKQASVVVATFLYQSLMREAMLPRR